MVFPVAMCDSLSMASNFSFSLDFEFRSSTLDDDDLTTASNTKMYPIRGYKGSSAQYQDRTRVQKYADGLKRRLL